jgi:2-iminobutanoate/2-iminopropanoate deaminase
MIRSAALSALILLSACAEASPRPDAKPAAATSRKQVLVPGSGTAPLSSVVRVGDLVFVSGQLGFSPGTRDLAPGGIGPETRVALEGVAANLAKVGLTMDDVVKCSVFLADMADFAAMNEVYAKAFPKDPPARTTVAVAGLFKGARTEIECIAAARP